MNLLIEQGNSSAKVAIYNKGIREASFVYEKFDTAAMQPLFELYKLRYGIMSSVIMPDEELQTELRKRLERFIWLDEQVPTPLVVKYKTPATLGKDRLAAVVGAFHIKPGHDSLVIDAGTAITYDLVDSTGAYLGGNISPGMNMRFKALHSYTKQLPLVTISEAEVPLIGDSTETAIRSGVANGIVYEMDGVINKLRIRYPELFIFLTGGNSFYFARRLENITFADINLVLTGLNRILEYNVEN
ncbi:MAG: type III pantothenate kinase [Tannerellaceae bacterium]|nr:type III pantothenate kinase [Tannerellaceae bacterium]